MKIEDVDVNKILRHELSKKQLECALEILSRLQEHKVIDINLEKDLGKYHSNAKSFTTRVLVLLGLMRFKRKGHICQMTRLNSRIAKEILDNHEIFINKININPFLDLLSITKKEVILEIDMLLNRDMITILCKKFCEEYMVAPIVLRESLKYLKIIGVTENNMRRDGKSSIKIKDREKWDKIILLTGKSLGVFS